MPRRFSVLLLGLTLLTTQWLLAVHELHDQVHPPAHQCQLCLAATSLHGNIPGLPALAPAVGASHVLVPAPAPVSATAVRPRLFQPRAPPVC